MPKDQEQLGYQEGLKVATGLIQYNQHIGHSLPRQREIAKARLGSVLETRKLAHSDPWLQGYCRAMIGTLQGFLNKKEPDFANPTQHITRN